MSETIGELSKAYDEGVTCFTKMMILRTGASSADVLLAMHVVHLEHLKKTYEAMELTKSAFGERVSFADYLRKVADGQEEK